MGSQVRVSPVHYITVIFVKLVVSKECRYFSRKPHEVLCQTKSYVVVCFQSFVSVNAALSRKSSYGESQRAQQFRFRLTQQPVLWHSPPHQSGNEILVLF